jgi:hypothetical protein
MTQLNEFPQARALANRSGVSRAHGLRFYVEVAPGHDGLDDARFGCLQPGGVNSVKEVDKSVSHLVGCL